MDSGGGGQGCLPRAVTASRRSRRQAAPPPCSSPRPARTWPGAGCGTENRTSRVVVRGARAIATCASNSTAPLRYLVEALDVHLDRRIGRHADRLHSRQDNPCFPAPFATAPAPAPCSHLVELLAPPVRCPAAPAGNPRMTGRIMLSVAGSCASAIDRSSMRGGAPVRVGPGTTASVYQQRIGRGRRRPAAPRAATARGAAPIGCETCALRLMASLVGAATGGHGSPRGAGQQIGQHPNRARRVAELRQQPVGVAAEIRICRRSPFATIPPARQPLRRRNRAREIISGSFCGSEAVLVFRCCTSRVSAPGQRRVQRGDRLLQVRPFTSRCRPSSVLPRLSPICWNGGGGNGSHSASPSARRLRGDVADPPASTGMT